MASKLDILSQVLVEKYNLPQGDATQFVKAVFDVVKENLLTDKIVKVKGLGTFKLTEVNARASVDVNTGERINIEGHTKISFTPENAVRDRINAPFSQFESFDLEDDVDFQQIDNKYSDGKAPAALEEPEKVEEPAVAEPAVAEPVAVEPVAVEPVAVELVAAEPVAVEPVAAEPVAVEPVAAEPVAAEPVAVEPVAVEPVAVEPTTVELEPENNKPEVVEDDTSELRDELRRTNGLVRILLGIVVVLILLILAFGAYVYQNHYKADSANTEEPVAVAVADTTACDTVAAVKDTTTIVTEEKAEVPNRHTHRIVGEEKIIVLDKSMSIREICEENGGEYMRDFIWEVNPRKKYYQRGDTIVIPKIEKKY